MYLVFDDLAFLVNHVCAATDETSALSNFVKRNIVILIAAKIFIQPDILFQSYLIM